ncbi:MAG TPA: TetR/AcrR family transcriptional regulator [Nocardioidaceae bacterium]|nr:TetR/AcrR family transcriptional regulator [Nocardioidaceae bacterium]
MTETITAGRRADARRNIARILDAAVERLSEDPGASVGSVAEAAGVGRVTLYGHFPSRDALVEAAVRHAIDRGEERLADVDLSGEPRAAMERLIQASWELVAQFRNVLIAAQDALSPARIRELHAKPGARAAELIERGQEAGVFRSDLPVTWLVGVLHSVIHGAADEINAGRLTTSDAPRTISATVLAAYTPPGSRTPKG